MYFLVDVKVGVGGSDGDGAVAAGARAGSALLPGNVELLSEGNGGIVVGKLSGSVALGAGQGNAVVDVEDTGSTAWRPDSSGRFDAVSLGIYLPVLECSTSNCGHAGGRSLAGILREVVGGNEVTSDTLIETSISVVGGVNNGVLKASGILEVQVELAVLAAVRDGSSGANIGLELIKSISNHGLVRRGAGGDGALRAAIARVRGADDLDIIWVGSAVTLRSRECGDERSEEEELGKHLDSGDLMRLKVSLKDCLATG